jgi:predicted nucleic acid-binding Zn ribbon protein
MRKYIYYCPKCKQEIEVHHDIGVIDSIKCKCGKKMRVKIQAVAFKIGGKYTAETGYSDSSKEE